MKKDVTLTIDGREVTVPAGSTILDAASKLGIEIPTLCHNETISPFTACFLCVVELEGRANLVPSCGTIVADGMKVSAGTTRVAASRKMCLELLLSDHCGDCVAPCTLACPAGCKGEQFIRLLAEDRNEEAIKVIKENLPIPGALGRVCPRPCETKCRRNRVEEPLAIGWLHRFAADIDEAVYRPEAGPETGKKVAILGAGPAGMSAAYFLRQKGHAVTVFESKLKPGGMLAFGIPAYRLPREELARELQAIIEMGVEMRYGSVFGKDFSIADLRKQGFDAIFIAIGAQLSSSLRTEGEELSGVMGGIELLGRVALGEEVALGDRVVVVGGGNTAIDAARTAVRLGAKEVTLLYRRTRAEMPALPIEQKEAEREGVKFKLLSAPLSISVRGQRLNMLCQAMQLGAPDESGRCRPVPIEGETFSIEADTVIAAIGQAIDADLLKREKIALDKRGRAIAVNPQSLQTEIPDIFAGGDAVASDDDKIAVWAVGSGMRAAASINQFLSGKPVTGLPSAFNSTMGENPEDVVSSRFEGIAKEARAIMPELEPEARGGNFREVELGFSPETARAEAGRCLECGCAAADDCKLRDYSQEYCADAKRFAGEARSYTHDASHEPLVLEQGKCVDCGICVRLGEADEGIFGFVSRGFDTRVKPYFAGPASRQLEKLAEECADACPTGAIVKAGKGRG